MNVYRNKNTGLVIEIPSEFGNSKVWAVAGAETRPGASREPILTSFKSRRNDYGIL